MRAKQQQSRKLRGFNQRWFCHHEGGVLEAAGPHYGGMLWLVLPGDVPDDRAAEQREAGEGAGLGPGDQELLRAAAKPQQPQ